MDLSTLTALRAALAHGKVDELLAAHELTRVDLDLALELAESAVLGDTGTAGMLLIHEDGTEEAVTHGEWMMRNAEQIARVRVLPLTPRELRARRAG